MFKIIMSIKEEIEYVNKQDTKNGQVWGKMKIKVIEIKKLSG